MELSTLLQEEDQEMELQTSSHSVQPTFTLVPKKVNTIVRWIKAFNCFTAVYPWRWPEEVPGLLEHMKVVIRLSHPESKFIREVARLVLQQLIGQTCSISTLPLLLTGSRGEYLKVVGIIVMVE